LSAHQPDNQRNNIYQTTEYPKTRGAKHFFVEEVLKVESFLQYATKDSLKFGNRIER
jgi:hypothetical protein